MADWNIQEYREQRIVFYGSRHCPLPRQLFVLFDKCRTRYEKHPDLTKRYSHCSLTFSEEKAEAVQKRFGEASQILDPTHAMVWVSLFRNTASENEMWFLIGMGSQKDSRTEVGMEALSGLNQLLIRADGYLTGVVYKRVSIFARQNPKRYRKEYFFWEKPV